MNFTERQELTCDEALALYLANASKCVNFDYYKTIMRFVLLYRQCVNDYGWLRRRDHIIRCGWDLGEDEKWVEGLRRDGIKESTHDEEEGEEEQNELRSQISESQVFAREAEGGEKDEAEKVENTNE